MPLYPFKCPKCEETTEIPMSMTEYSEGTIWDCDHCDANVTRDDRIMCAANVTRASYIDGTKRKGFAENREMLELTKASYNMKPEDRGDIKKTIKNIEKSGKN